MKTVFSQFSVALMVLFVVPLIALAANLLNVDANAAEKSASKDATQDKIVILNDAASVVVNWRAGGVQSLTLNRASTNLTLRNGQAGGEYILIVKQDAAGGHLITWPAAIQWAGGIAPTLSSAPNSVDVIRFLYDGSTYLGSYTLNYKPTSAPPPPTGSVVFNANCNATGAASSHTCTLNATGSNIGIVIGVHDINHSLSSVTVNGSNATQVENVVWGSGDAEYLYYFAPTSSGSQTVSISHVDDGNNFSLEVNAYTGVKSSGQPSSHTNHGGSSGTNAITLSPGAGSGSMMVSEFRDTDSGNASSLTNGAIRDSSAGISIGDSGSGITSSSAYTLTWGSSGTHGNEATALVLDPN